MLVPRCLTNKNNQWLLVVISIVVISVLFLAPTAWADSNESESFHINIPSKHLGISFGNSRGVNGIRINLCDDGLEYVNGLNLTLWKPKENNDAVIRGFAIGIVAPQADRINGIALGGIGVSGGKLRGITVGTIGIASDEVRGIGIGGIGLASGRISGITFGGIGIAAERLRGIGIGGIGIASESVTGFAFGGIGAAMENVKGIGIGGIGVACESVTGLVVGGVGAAAEDVTGVAFGGIGIAAEDMTGLCLGGIGIGCQNLTGVAMAVGGIKTEDLTGLGIAGYCGVKGVQNGLTIGVVNYTDELHGAQLGVINIAGNNSGILKVLPLVNYHR